MVPYGCCLPWCWLSGLHLFSRSLVVVLHELLYTALQGVITTVKMVLLEDLLFTVRDDMDTQNEVAQ